MPGAEQEIRGIATVASGRVVIRALAVSHPADITTKTLRDLPLGEIRRRIHEDIQNRPELLSWVASGRIPDSENPFAWLPVSPADQKAERERVYALVDEIELRKAGSRGRRYDPKFLENIARWYRKCYEQDPKAPSKALAELLRNGRNEQFWDITEAQVRGWVNEARRDGWLAPTGPGRASAAPGPRLLNEKKGV